MLGARLDETHQNGAFAMHGHTTDSGLIRPRRRQEPPARSTGSRRLVVAQLPDVSPADREATGSIHYRFDHVDTTSLPLSDTSQPTEKSVQAAPVTRDWYRLTSGLAISAFLLYLAVHSLLEMQRVRNNVDAGTVTQNQRLDVADSPTAAAAPKRPASSSAPATPQFIGNPVIADPQAPARMLTETDVIEFPSGVLPMDGSSDPIESTRAIHPSRSPKNQPSITARESAAPPPAPDLRGAAQYPGTGYPSIQTASPTQPAGEVNDPDRPARLSGIIEKYTGPN